MATAGAVHDPRAGLSTSCVGHSAEYQNQAGSLDSCALIVELEGLPYEYAFSEEDLYDLFGRYGQLKVIEFLDATIAPDIALVEFRNPQDAVQAVSHLNNFSMLFDGHQIVLSVNYYDEAMDAALQSKLRIATAQALQQSGPSAVMTGPKYNVANSAGHWQCRFVIGAEVMDRDFPVVGRIIGPSGAHMKSIHEKTGAKLRLRGRRSNYKEGPENKESDDLLHLCISANDEVAFHRACEMFETLMAGVYNDYGSWCVQHSVPIPNIRLLCIEGPFTEPLEWKIRQYYEGGALEASGSY